MLIESSYEGLLPESPSAQPHPLKVSFQSCSKARALEIVRRTEQRRNRRTYCDRQVAIWHRDAYGDVARTPAMGLNISSGGIRVMCSQRLAAGEELGVQLRRDRDVLYARVAWVKPSNDGCVAGISFRGDVFETPYSLMAQSQGMC